MTGTGAHGRKTMHYIELCTISNGDAKMHVGLYENKQKATSCALLAWGFSRSIQVALTSGRETTMSSIG